MNQSASRPPRSVWFWPALLGVGNVVALIAALVADGSLGWDLVCWALLLAPMAVVARALRPAKNLRWC